MSMWLRDPDADAGAATCFPEALAMAHLEAHPLSVGDLLSHRKAESGSFGFFSGLVL